MVLSQNDKIIKFEEDFKSNPGKYMFFLGAGFSTDLGLPTASELTNILRKNFAEKIKNYLSDEQDIDLDSLIALLLQNGVEKREICKIINKNLESRLDLTKIAFDNSSLGLFYRIIDDIVNKFEGEKSPARVHIATTNWDDTIIKIFGARALSIYSKNEKNVREEMEKKRILVYYLHGIINDFDSMLLTREEKEQAERNDDKVLDHLKGAARTHRIIFLGYSISDKNILNVYLNVRRDIPSNEGKDYIIIDNDESRIKIEEQLKKNNIDDRAEVIVKNASGFLGDLATSMGLISDKEKIKLRTEDHIKEKLSNRRGLILSGIPSSGLTTLYLNYYASMPEDKLCLEYRYNSDERDSFFKVLDKYLNDKKEVALFVPDYLFQVYLSDYTKKEKEELRKEIEKNIEKIWIFHQVYKDEAKVYLDQLIKKSGRPDKFDDELKEKILELVKQEEREKLISFKIENYPIKLIRDVFLDVNDRIANGENLEKIKGEIDEKISFRDEVEKLFGIDILFGLAFLGARASDFTVPESFGQMEAIRKIERGLAPIIGAVSLAFPYLALGSVIAGIYEFIESLKEKRKEIDKLVQLKNYWNSLKKSEKEMLCYKLDRKNNLRPGLSYDFMNNFLSDEKWNDLMKEMDKFKENVKNNLQEFQEKLNEFEKNYGRLIDELSTLNEDVKTIKDQINSIQADIEQIKRGMITLAGLEQVDDIKTLQQYYNVDPNVMADIHNEFEISNGEVNGKRSKKSFSTLVKELRDWNEDSNPWIYVITGPSGTGKSWFTYRVINEIFNKNELDIRNRSGDRGRFSFFIIESPSDFKYPVVNENDHKNLMFIDDSAIEIDKINELEKILASFLHKDKGAIGPVIITIEYNRWAKLLERKMESLNTSGLEREVSKLKEKVAQIFLEKTSYEEVSMVLDNLSKSSEYSNIIIPDKIKGKIVEKAEGLPIIIKIFLESIKYQKAKDKEKYEVTDIDVEEIDKDPTEYAMKKLWGFYIPKEWRNNKGNYLEEISQILSLLNSIVKFSKPMPLAVLDINFLKKILNYVDTDQNLLYKYNILNIIKVANFYIDYNIESNKMEVRMLFFKLDKKGFLTPIHDIVRGGINGLINKYDCIDYTDQIIKEINNILNEKLDYVFNGPEFKIRYNIKDAYYSLSLSIMSNRIDYQIKSLKFTFELNKKIESSNVNKNIDLLANQLNTIFWNILNTLDEHELLELIKNGEDLIEKLFKTNDQEDRLESWKLGLEMLDIATTSKEIKGIMDRNKSYLIEFLNSEDYRIRSSAWYIVTNLIDRGIISNEVAIEKKEYFKELLSSGNYGIRRSAWYIITDLIDRGIISNEVAIEKKEYFKELLSSEDDDIRIDACNIVTDLIDSGIISNEDAIYFKELLSSGNYGIRIDAWYIVTDLIDRRIISNEDAIEKKEYLEELLSSGNYGIRRSAWDIVTDLIDRWIISNEDAIYFKELLSSGNYGIRIDAWYKVTKLIDSGIISNEDAIEKKEYLEELLSSENDDIRSSAWDIVTDLIYRGIISNEDAIEKKEYFKELLSSGNYGIRRSAWDIVTKLIDSGIISNEDAIEKKEYFKELLTSGNYRIRMDAWYIVTDLIDRRIISNEDAIEKKEYLEELLSSENGYIRSYVWDIVIKLIDSGIISNEDAIYFKVLLSSGNYGIRIDAWYKVTKLIDSGIISNEDAIEKKEYFKRLLSSGNYVIRKYAWDIVTKLIDRGIISNKEVRDKC